MTEMDFNHQQFIAYAADPGSFSPPQQAAIEAALRSDPGAQRTVHMYRLARQSFASDDSVNPSPAAIERARQVFSLAVQSHQQGQPTWLDQVRELLARLVYDSRVQPAAVRSTGMLDQVLLTFETNAGEVEVEARRTMNDDGSTRWNIVGQVSGLLAGSARTVELRDRATGQVTATTRANESGVFALETVPGRYVLLVTGESGTLAAAEMEIE